MFGQDEPRRAVRGHEATPMAVQDDRVGPTALVGVERRLQNAGGHVVRRVGVDQPHVHGPIHAANCIVARMPLDPQVQAMRDRRVRDGVVPLYTLTVEQARAEDLAAIRSAGGDPEPVHGVVDRTIPGPAGILPIRIYRPDVDGPLPTLVYFFGGGWTLGSVDTSDGICRSLTNAAGCMVVTVGYRLAPEHPFPAAVRGLLRGGRVDRRPRRGDRRRPDPPGRRR